MIECKDCKYWQPEVQTKRLGISEDKTSLYGNCSRCSYGYEPDSKFITYDIHGDSSYFITEQSFGCNQGVNK